jgi:hypothetical protein
MRILIAGVLGGLAMYVWATVAHLSPLAAIGIHTMPNDRIVVAALKLNLGDKAGVYIYPTPPAGMAPPTSDARTAAEGMLSYVPNGPAGLTPRQLIVEFALEMIEALLMAAIAGLAAVGFGRRVAIAILVGLIAAMTTNASYWNWWGFGLDYTLANGTIELIKYLVAGVVIALVLGRRGRAAGA